MAQVKAAYEEDLKNIIAYWTRHGLDNTSKWTRDLTQMIIAFYKSPEDEFLGFCNLVKYSGTKIMGGEFPDEHTITLQADGMVSYESLFSSSYGRHSYTLKGTWCLSQDGKSIVMKG